MNLTAIRICVFERSAMMFGALTSVSYSRRACLCAEFCKERCDVENLARIAIIMLSSSAVRLRLPSSKPWSRVVHDFYDMQNVGDS